MKTRIKPKGSYASLSDVVLKKSAFFENRARAIGYLKLLDCDRMLQNFRAAFGVPSKAEPIGGWEAEPDSTMIWDDGMRVKWIRSFQY